MSAEVASESLSTKQCAFWGHTYAVIIKLLKNGTIREHRKTCFVQLFTLQSKAHYLLAWAAIIQHMAWEVVRHQTGGKQTISGINSFCSLFGGMKKTLRDTNLKFNLLLFYFVIVFVSNYILLFILLFSINKGLLLLSNSIPNLIIVLQIYYSYSKFNIGIPNLLFFLSDSERLCCLG